jgi:hypothetical protein
MNCNYRREDGDSGEYLQEPRLREKRGKTEYPQWVGSWRFWFVCDRAHCSSASYCVTSQICGNG